MDGEGERGRDEAEALAAAAGDGGAFAALLERHYDRIYRLGWRLLGTEAEAEDLAQDVCLALGAKIRGFRGEAAFSTWLHRVVVNAARDRLRKRARAGRLDRRYAETEALARAGGQARAEELAWLDAALAALTPELRETAALVLEAGLSHAQAGAALGVSGGTVSWRMSEIRKRLARLADRAEDVGP